MTQWVKWVWTTSPCAKAECSSEYLSPSTRDSGKKKKKTGPRGPRASQSNGHRERQDSERPCLEKRNEILSDEIPRINFCTPAVSECSGNTMKGADFGPLSPGQLRLTTLPLIFPLLAS